MKYFQCLLSNDLNATTELKTTLAPFEPAEATISFALPATMLICNELSPQPGFKSFRRQIRI